MRSISYGSLCGAWGSWGSGWLGASLGIAYGLVGVPLVIIIITATVGTGNFSALGGLLLFSFFGSIFGLFLGAAIGLPLGAVQGVLLFIITRLYRGYPSYAGTADGVRGYHQRAGRACAMASALVFFAVFCAPAFWFLSMRPMGNLDARVDSYLLDVLLFVIGPAPIACFGAWWSGRQVAGQYARKVAGENELLREDEASATDIRP